MLEEQQVLPDSFVHAAVRDVKKHRPFRRHQSHEVPIRFRGDRHRLHRPGPEANVAERQTANRQWQTPRIVRKQPRDGASDGERARATYERVKEKGAEAGERKRGRGMKENQVGTTARWGM